MEINKLHDNRIIVFNSSFRASEIRPKVVRYIQKWEFVARSKVDFMLLQTAAYDTKCLLLLKKTGEKNRI